MNLPRASGMTQADRVLALLNMTQGVDVRDFPAGFRLAARIKDLRDAGHAITTTTLTLSGGAKVARYTLNDSRRCRACGSPGHSFCSQEALPL